MGQQGQKGQNFNPEVVRRRLRRCGVSQQEFAALAQLSEDGFCDFMTRKRQPSVVALRKIALALAALPELPGIRELLSA